MMRFLASESIEFVYSLEPTQHICMGIYMWVTVVMRSHLMN